MSQQYIDYGKLAYREIVELYKRFELLEQKEEETGYKTLSYSIGAATQTEIKKDYKFTATAEQTASITISLTVSPSATLIVKLNGVQLKNIYFYGEKTFLFENCFLEKGKNELSIMLSGDTSFSNSEIKINVSGFVNYFESNYYFETYSMPTKSYLLKTGEGGLWIYKYESGVFTMLLNIKNVVKACFTGVNNNLLAIAYQNEDKILFVSLFELSSFTEQKTMMICGDADSFSVSYCNGNCFVFAAVGGKMELYSFEPINGKVISYAETISNVVNVKSEVKDDIIYLVLSDAFARNKLAQTERIVAPSERDSFIFTGGC